MHKLSSWILGSSLAFGCAGRAPQRVEHPEPARDSFADVKAPAELPPREDLPLEAREMLTARMMRHGERMTILMATVVLLDYDATAALADDLAEEPRLGRPAPGEKDTLNALLPPSFFQHQDELVTRSRALAAAARAQDDQRLVNAFAELAKTCVSCHSVYLHGELEAPDHEELEPDDVGPCDPGDDCAEAPAGPSASQQVRGHHTAL